MPTNSDPQKIGNNFFDFKGGHPVGNNLFHSFSDFQLDSGDTASFSSQGASNILSRVTGSNPSNLFGTLGVDVLDANRSNANLFFLNPNGVVFGPNSSLDLNGSFHVSTADFIRLGDGPGAGMFSASDPAANLLTSAPPSAFGFLNSNPGSLVVREGAQVSVESQNTLSFVGGSIDIVGGELTTQSGDLNLASVASTSEAQINPSGLDVNTFESLGG